VTAPQQLGTFVARDEHERIAAALAELASAHGYEAVTVAQIAARAEVSRDCFDRHFATKEDCFGAGYDAAMEQAFSAAAEAFVATPGSWAEAAHAALGGLLRFVAGAPAVAALFVATPLNVREPALVRRRRAFELFSEFLEPGFAQSGRRLPDRQLLVEMIAGGIFQIFALHAATGRIAQLSEALPAVTLVTLGPFIGHDEALRLAGSEPPRAGE
jgi:AcrR family transcriptional regulator